MKVLGAYRGDAAGYFRIVAPFSVLSFSTEHTFSVATPTLASSEQFDILWLNQHSDPVAEIIVRDFKDYGRSVIYDVDDFLFSMPVSWTGYDGYFVRGKASGTDRLMFHERLIRMADVVTCTTQVLKDCLVGLLGLAPENVVVLPNCVLQGDWDTIVPATHAKPGPVLGWFGTGNHWDDWSEIVNQVDEALENVNGHLALMGAPEVVCLFPDRLAARTSVHPLVPMKRFDDVRRLITAFDVGLAWTSSRLTAHRCRSPLKALQYGAARVPCVASNEVYGAMDGWEWDRGSKLLHGYGITVGSPYHLSDALTYAFTGELPFNDTPEEWDSAISESCRDWQEEVWKNHTYETQAYRWLEVAQRVCPDVLVPDEGPEVI